MDEKTKAPKTTKHLYNPKMCVKNKENTRTQKMKNILIKRK